MKAFPLLLGLLIFLFSGCSSKAELAAIRRERDQARQALHACETERNALDSDATQRDIDNANADLRQSSPPQTPTTAPTWAYLESRDEMRDATARTACLDSSNSYEFHSPYDGGTRARICFRQSPQFGFDAYMTINRGQFQCGLGCTLRMKVDDDALQRFEGNPPNSGNSNLVFWRHGDASRVLSAIKSGHRLILEADFYGEGSRQFRFDDVTGLDWELPPPPRKLRSPPSVK